AVGGGRSLVEDERRPVAGRLALLLEEALVLPGREELALQRVHALLGIERRIRHQLPRARTPRTSVASAGSAARATTMMRHPAARSSASEGQDMSGNRGPAASSFGPTSGLSPRKLMWSASSTRSPASHSGCMPPQALLTINVPAPSARSTRTGQVTCARV